MAQFYRNIVYHTYILIHATWPIRYQGWSPCNLSYVGVKPLMQTSWRLPLVKWCFSPQILQEIPSGTWMEPYFMGINGFSLEKRGLTSYYSSPFSQERPYVQSSRRPWNFWSESKTNTGSNWTPLQLTFLHLKLDASWKMKDYVFVFFRDGPSVSFPCYSFAIMVQWKMAGYLKGFSILFEIHPCFTEPWPIGSMYGIYIPTFTIKINQM